LRLKTPPGLTKVRKDQGRPPALSIGGAALFFLDYCSVLFGNHRIRFYFNQPLRVYETSNLHNRIDRLGFTAKLRANINDGFLVVNICQDDARTHYVMPTGPGTFGCIANNLKTAFSLLPCISDADGIAVLVYRGCPTNRDIGANPNGPGKPNDFFHRISV
jgi:hypothetical protein